MSKRIKEIDCHNKIERFKEMWQQIKWIYQYAKYYWKPMIFYTLLGIFGTVIGLLSSWISKKLIDIITGQETGALVQTFAIMIGLNLGMTFISQISNYASSWISMKVDADIKTDIFSQKGMYKRRKLWYNKDARERTSFPRK